MRTQDTTSIDKHLPQGLMYRESSRTLCFVTTVIQYHWARMKGQVNTFSHTPARPEPGFSDSKMLENSSNFLRINVSAIHNKTNILGDTVLERENNIEENGKNKQTTSQVLNRTGHSCVERDEVMSHCLMESMGSKEREWISFLSLVGWQSEFEERNEMYVKN